MNKNKTNLIIKIINGGLAVLLFVIVLNFSIHAIKTKQFNDETHTSLSATQEKDLEVTGAATGVWPKEDALVDNVTNGGTYEFTIKNTREYSVAEWTMKLFIAQECS